MPELPEVETIRRGLARHIVGRTVAKVDVRLAKIFQPGGKAGVTRVVGAKVTKVKRRGKLLLIGLTTEETLVIHLKMTGQVIFRESTNIKLAGGHPIPTVTGDLPGKVTHVIITFTDSSQLFYNDLRQFGYIKLVSNGQLGRLPLIARFGPEPLSKAFTLVVFRERLKRRRRALLKPLLLDQTFLAGLGNIYVDEALNLARLHPLRVAGTLRRQQQRALYTAIRRVLTKALRYGGTSIKTYVTVRGGQGDYLRYARVYHRTGKSCRRCGTTIQRIVVAGRGTHLCPRCQRAPRKLVY